MQLAGITAHPAGERVTQQARNLLMALEDHADTAKFPLRDRGTKFTAAFDAVFTAPGVRIIKTPVQAPRANAILCQRPPAGRERPLTMSTNVRVLRRDRLGGRIHECTQVANVTAFSAPTTRGPAAS